MAIKWAFSDLRIGWRMLVKEPGYSAAVIAGLAVGFAACFLLLGFVRYSMRYNAHLADSGRIYQVKERRNALPRPQFRALAPAALYETALASGPGVDATRAKEYDLAVRVGVRVMPLTLRVAQANYLRFFGVRALTGDADAALARPDVLVLSQAVAHRLFGPDAAPGMVAHIDGLPFTLGAVLPDMPGNTTVGLEALVGSGVHTWDRPKPDAPPDAAWRSAWEVYVKLERGADPAGLAALLQDAVTRQRDARYMTPAWRARSHNGRMTDIAVTRLSDLYFDADLRRGRNASQYGDKATVAGLAALALLILALALTNYVNLSTVRSGQRRREIAVRKVLGAGPLRLAGLFIGESMLVALLAGGLGVLLAWLAAPLFAELVDRPLQGMFPAPGWLAALVPAIAVGLLSAAYPAWLAWRLPAGDTMHGRADTESATGLRVRRALSVFQFAAAICLIGLTLAVTWQTRHASHADPGFDPGPVLVVTLPESVAPRDGIAFQDALARLPGVDGVAAISEAIGRDGFTIIGTVSRPDGTTVPIEHKAVSAGFFEVLGVAAQAGRLFDARQDQAGTGNVVINAMAARALGFASPEAAVGQLLGERRIIGIAPDLRYRSLRQLPEPLMYQLDAAQPVLLVSVNGRGGDRAAMHAALDAAFHAHFPNALVDIEAAAAIFADNYAEDLRLARMLACASAVATALAAFGIYVLAAYSVRRRAREFILRKIHGARGPDIARLVLREFALLVGAGGAIGLPLAWAGTERYLAPFVERAPMGPWPLLSALLLVTLVALGATSRHTLSAMRMAPAAALRAV